MKQDLTYEFTHPSSEFAPLPFWFWNDELTEYEIDRQICDFKEKGVDGFVIHARMGLPESIPYMGERWMEFVKFAVARAKELDMHVILYDEAAYPSGSAHGEVVRRNPAHASRGLCMRTEPTICPGECEIAHIKRDGSEYWFIETDTKGTIRGVYYGEDDNQPNAPRAADLLNPDAVDSFIALTHERYYEILNEYFGSTVIGIFTDEPSMVGRRCISGIIPWTGNFLNEYLAAGGSEQDLYHLFCYTDTPECKHVRTLYNHTLYKRLGRVFYGKLSVWCAEHGIALIGHPEKSTDIGYLSYFQIPCQDIVWRYIYPGDDSCVTGDHSTMGKCASDSARHRGKRRNGNECFGVCSLKGNDYAFPREHMKWYIDWLAVRGCNMYIPHAFFYSIRDDRGSERPPDVGPHREYWDDYKEITDYIKRLCALNCDSVNVTDVAIMCDEETLSWQAAKPLYENQIEFNYLERELIPELTLLNGAAHIRGYAYRVIITDRKWDAETEAFLTAFTAAGGKVIRYDSEHEADYVSAVRSASNTTISVRNYNPYLRMTRIRKYDHELILFTNEGEETINTVIGTPRPVIERWDAEDGSITSIDAPACETTLSLAPRKSILFALEENK